MLAYGVPSGSKVCMFSGTKIILVALKIILVGLKIILVALKLILVGLKLILVALKLILVPLILFLVALKLFLVPLKLFLVPLKIQTFEPNGTPYLPAHLAASGSRSTAGVNLFHHKRESVAYSLSI